MTRKPILASLTMLFLLGPTAALAGDIKAVVSKLPAETVAFVCVPSLNELDARYQRLLKDLQLQDRVPPQAGSLSGLVRQYLQLGEGFDADGPLVVLVLSAQNAMEFATRSALLLPVTNPRETLERLEAQSTEEGLWMVNVAGQPSFAAVGEGRLIVAAAPDTARSIAASAGGLDKKLPADQLRSLKSLDLALWIDAQRLLTQFKPQIDGFLSMVSMMQAGGGPFAAKQAEIQKKQMDMYFEGLASLSLGVALKPEGLNLRFAMNIKPGTELHRRSLVRTTQDSLLTGLPSEGYVLAFGQTADPGQMKAAVSDLENYVALASSAEGINRDLVEKLKAHLQTWLSAMTGVHGSVQTHDPGEHGVFAASIVVDVPDARKWVADLAEAVRLAKEIVSDENFKAVGETGRAVAGAVSFEPEAEEIGGAKIGHLKLDLAKIEALDEDDVDEINQVIGADGLLFRVAAINEQSVGIAFGGGTAHMGRFMELVSKKESPLSADPGIKKVSAQLARERFSVVYVAVDRLLTAVRNVQIARDDEPFPVQMPPINAPLAVAGTGAEGWSQVDIVVPTELMVAGKNTIMAMMGMGGGPPPSPAATEKDEEKEE